MDNCGGVVLLLVFALLILGILGNQEYKARKMDEISQINENCFIRPNPEFSDFCKAYVVQK